MSSSVVHTIFLSNGTKHAIVHMFDGVVHLVAQVLMREVEFLECKDV